MRWQYFGTFPPHDTGVGQQLAGANLVGWSEENTGIAFRLSNTLEAVSYSYVVSWR